MKSRNATLLPLLRVNSVVRFVSDTIALHMRRWKERIWPTITDQASATQAIERAVRITTIWAVINVATGATSLWSGARITERNPIEWNGIVLDNGGASASGFIFLFLGALFGVVAWKIRGMSRGWTLGGLIIAAVILLSDFATSPSPIALVMHMVVLLYFINVVWATAVFERSQPEHQM